MKWEPSQLSVSNQGHFPAIPACHDINLIRVPFSWPLLGAFADVSENGPHVKQSGTRYGLYVKVDIRASVWTYGDTSSTQVSPNFTRLTCGNVRLKWRRSSHDCELVCSARQMRLCALLPGYSPNNKKHPWHHIRNALAFQIMSISDFFNWRTPAVISLHCSKVSGSDANRRFHNWCNIWFKVVVQKCNFFFLILTIFQWRQNSQFISKRHKSSFRHIWRNKNPCGISACAPLLVSVISRFVQGASHHITWIWFTYD